MANVDETKVGAGSALVTGAIFIAPASAALPTDATTALADDYKCLGYTSDDGVTISEDGDSEDITAWEGRKKVRTIKTEYTESIAFTPIECSEQVAKAMWGDGRVTVDAEKKTLAIKHHGDTMEPVNIVIETVPTPSTVDRYCARAQLVERGDQTLDGTQNQGRELTFDCIADAANVTMTEYLTYTA